jgi:hypothetical protein
LSGPALVSFVVVTLVLASAADARQRTPEAERAHRRYLEADRNVQREPGAGAQATPGSTSTGPTSSPACGIVTGGTDVPRLAGGWLARRSLAGHDEKVFMYLEKADVRWNGQVRSYAQTVNGPYAGLDGKLRSYVTLGLDKDNRFVAYATEPDYQRRGTACFPVEFNGTKLTLRPPRYSALEFERVELADVQLGAINHDAAPDGTTYWRPVVRGNATFTIRNAGFGSARFPWIRVIVSGPSRDPGAVRALITSNPAGFACATDTDESLRCTSDSIPAGYESTMGVGFTPGTSNHVRVSATVDAANNPLNDKVDTGRFAMFNFVICRGHEASLPGCKDAK